MNRLPTLLASIAFALGAAAAITALTLWNQQQRFIDSAQRVAATVVDIREMDGRRIPVFQFTEPDTSIQRLSLDNVPADGFHAGDKVALLFDPFQPTRSRLAGFRAQWLEISLYALCSAVLLALAGCLFRSRRPRAAPHATQ